MSWIQQLVQVYDDCTSEVAWKGIKDDGSGYTSAPLLPLHHMTQQAHIQAAIDSEGNWLPGMATILPKEDCTTILPCTEDSSTRTNPCPHGLSDQLPYLAGDYLQEFGPQKNGNTPHTLYMNQLKEWVDSPFSHPVALAVYRYLEKNCLIADLVKDGLLYRQPDGFVASTWSKGLGPKDHTVYARANPDKALLRIRVYTEDGYVDSWADRSIMESWIQFVNSKGGRLGLCYALGKNLPLSRKSPKYIRETSDGTKLISCNDKENFTFRGRFQNAEQAFSISQEATQKAHNTLRWLISRQGEKLDGQVIVSWQQDGHPTLKLTEDSVATFFQLFPDEETPSTGENFAAALRKGLAGINAKLTGAEKACIMGLDSTSKEAKGRLSIFYYQELPDKELVQRIEHWQTGCSFFMHYRYIPGVVDEKGKKKWVDFIGSPSFRDIGKAAYGEKADNKVLKATRERLLPCVVSGAHLPLDIVRATANRASRPESMEAWEAAKTLSIACALIRKYNNDLGNTPVNKEEWSMYLDTQENNRDYLFGRALAYAQKLEEYALNTNESGRATNAERYRAAFSQHPARTWNLIDRQLQPYIQRLGDRADYYSGEMNNVLSRIETADFNDKPLSPLYLLGYACQMEAFRAYAAQKKAEKNKTDETIEE